LPDHVQASPRHPDNLANAVGNATRLGAPWAFTSDGVTLLLLEVNRTGHPQERIVHRIDLLPFANRSELDNAVFLARVQLTWSEALHELVPILTRVVAPEGMAIDEVFIESLRALLASPVAAVRAELERRRSNPSFETGLVRWMVDERDWVHLPAEWDAELLRTARLASYVFTTRLMFYPHRPCDDGPGRWGSLWCRTRQRVGMKTVPPLRVSLLGRSPLDRPERAPRDHCERSSTRPYLARRRRERWWLHVDAR
jgi:hypothetical protein